LVAVICRRPNFNVTPDCALLTLSRLKKKSRVLAPGLGQFKFERIDILGGAMFSTFRRFLASITLCMLLVMGAVAQNGKSAKKSGALRDINSASVSELKARPGIGDAYSAKIIVFQDQVGLTRESS
jgi:DNA uptake protein ComE-like DNA-binding protein